MINFERAVELAQSTLNTTQIEQCLELDAPGSRKIILWHAVRELAHGWMFPYNSLNCIEMGNALLGNGPVLVSRWGTIESLGTGSSIENRIHNYESNHRVSILKFSALAAFKKVDIKPMRETELYRQKLDSYRTYIACKAIPELKDRWLRQLQDLETT